MQSPNLPSVLNHNFSQVPKADIPRSSFSRKSSHKTTFNAGYLVPIFCDEVLPGDTHHLKTSIVARLNTPINPVMDNLYLDEHYFFVPMRLVWDNFQKFMGEQDDPGDSTDFLIPEVDPPFESSYELGSLYDYFGIPTYVGGMSVNALPFRAYNLIYNQWFRDENLIDSVPLSKDDGPDDDTDYVLRRRGKRHDYFTSCLPWPQKGDAVPLPLGNTAPITGTGDPTNVYGQSSATEGFMSVNSGDDIVRWNGTTTLGTTLKFGGDVGLEADLTQATGATVNSLRLAFQIQRMYEKDARGGTRYTEIVLQHFGVSSPDSRLQRPEYLGGGSSRIDIFQVPQTSSTDATSPQGNLSAFGQVESRGSGFTKSFTEHGYIIGLASVRADYTYQYGLHKMWTRRTRLDLYWPTLAHLGEQEVLNSEILMTENTGYNNAVFGYQERYAEYRYKPSYVSGLFRSNAPQSLDVWHLAESLALGQLILLNQDFIEEDPPVDRISSVPSQPHIKADCFFDLTSARPMPTYGVPGMMDHF